MNNTNPQFVSQIDPLTRGNLTPPNSLQKEFYTHESDCEKFPLEKGVAPQVTGVINSIGIFKANLKLKDRSKNMSKQMTKSEQLIWFNILSKRQLLGYKFTKQKIIFNYILDFYCSELLLAIEVDGESHNDQIEYDIVRTKFLNSLNIKVIRLTNNEVATNLEGAKTDLEKYIQSST
jgi:very-short-patch-repair endonuclease